MLVDVLVELFDHLWVVSLEILLQTHGDSKKDHVPGVHDLTHLGVDSLS